MYFLLNMVDFPANVSSLLEGNSLEVLNLGSFRDGPMFSLYKLDLPPKTPQDAETT